MDLDRQAQIIIDNIWKLLNDGTLKGLTVYQAAMKMGATDKLARKVETLWTGPEILD